MAKSQNTNLPGKKIQESSKANSARSPKGHSDSSKEENKTKSKIRKIFAKTGYAVWITVLAIGGVLAFIISLVAV